MKLKRIVMGKLKYVLKRLTDMNYKELINVVGRVHKKSHKNSIVLFCDIINGHVIDTLPNGTNVSSPISAHPILIQHQAT